MKFLERKAIFDSLPRWFHHTKMPPSCTQDYSNEKLDIRKISFLKLPHKKDHTSYKPTIF
jgi:hypothetical protein